MGIGRVERRWGEGGQPVQRLEGPEVMAEGLKELHVAGTEVGSEGEGRSGM